MSKAYFKHKLLLDEHLYHRRTYPMLNEHFDVKHIRDDLHHGGMDDSAVYKLAVEQGRIILTSNVKDFRQLIREDSPGVISIPETWSTDRVDTKLTALLMREKPSYFRGHLRPLATAGTQKQAA